MRGGVLPLPKYAFVAWCTVETKAQGQFYFHYVYIMRPHLGGIGWEDVRMGTESGFCEHDNENSGNFLTS